MAIIQQLTKPIRITLGEAFSRLLDPLLLRNDVPGTPADNRILQIHQRLIETVKRDFAEVVDVKDRRQYTLRGFNLFATLIVRGLSELSLFAGVAD